MTTHRFDAFTKAFSARLSRRAALKTTGLGLAAGLAGSSARRATAQEATPDPLTDDATFLFVQTATSGSFTANPGAGTPVAGATPVAGGGAGYLLTLEGHGGGTVYFSDRPERIFGESPTRQFLDGLGFPPGNPPNAALVTQVEDGTEDVIVLELLNPTYDEASGTITYGATILDEYTGEGLIHIAARQQDAILPETFGRASLFIDDCVTPDLIYCVSPDTNVIVGNVDYQNMCWSQRDSACVPCGGGFHGVAEECNNRFPECDDACIACTQSCAEE
ncbi:MAG: hypothetical protein M3457_19895, partial [Chloroflexota bacterium]|nr:hypothetical protein [Chloroflexota bacterium]